MSLLTGPAPIYDAQTFKDVTCQRETIRSKEFNTCVFRHCSLRETIFIDCIFRECRFEHSDLSLIQVKGCAFINTSFHECQLVGVNWTELDWERGRLLKPFDFHKCVLSYSTFIGLTLKQVSLTECICKDVDFAEADLTQADCRRTDFAASRFLNTNLTQADFTGARDYAIAPNLNQLKQTKFSLPEAMALLYGLDIILTED